MSPSQRADAATDRDVSVAERFVLAALPIVSVATQFWFAAGHGTTDLLLQHYTIVYVDLLFVPFNFFVARDIEWRRGRGLFALMIVAVVLNVASHSLWQHTGVDNGHMIGPDKVVHAAGWAHVAYSITQMTLVGAFLFLRRPVGSRYTPSTLFAALYFVAAAVSGYCMHLDFIMTDVLMTMTGLTVLLVGPWLMMSATTPADEPL